VHHSLRVFAGRARFGAQVLLLAVAIAIVWHGLSGPQVAPRNLATVLTSIHWRGLLIVALVIAGNLFCTACPMMLVRDAGRRFVAPRWRWPRMLRGKAVGIAALVLVLFFYELFNVWEHPAATAWIALGYFGLALLVDLSFKGASFCRHVCPVGQFNFVASTMSPLELRVRDMTTCHTCHTSDCIRGRKDPEARGRITQRGCELGLFLPAKVGNLDCTFCFDCVRACPHDNVSLATRVPAVEWLVPGRRSGLGRLERRTDLAALAAVFTFAALVSAFTMTAPARALHVWVLEHSPFRAEALPLGLLFVFGLGLLPAAVLTAAAITTQRITHATTSVRAIAMAFTYALVPVGFATWAAHYGFHLLTGMFTIVPVAQSAAADLFGSAVLGDPAWTWTGLRSGLVFPVQVGLLVLGAAGSLALVRATAWRDYPDRSGAAALPWVVVVLTLVLLALWILSQPMDMRGLAVG
jgi:ferredoxin